MTLIIGNTNFTSLAKRLGGYTVSYQKREGPLSGYMQDGSKTFDLLAWKAVVTWELIGLRTQELAQVLNAVMNNYVQVTYFDPKTNANRTATFIPDIGDLNVAFQRNNATFWKDGITITMEEK